MIKAAITPFPLRLPLALRAELDEKARQLGRSLQSEIVSRLQQSLSDSSSADTSEDEADAVRYMAAVKYLMDYGKKYDCNVTVQLSQNPEQILASAIKNGNLPPDATLADLKPQPIETRPSDEKPTPRKRTPPKPKA